VTLTLTLVTAKLRKLSSDFPKIVAQEVRRSYFRIGEQYRREMSDRMSAPIGGPPFFKTLGNERIHSRTGNTRGTIGYDVNKIAPIDQLRLRMFVGDKQTPGIRAHEYGATIKPKRGKYLTIPMPDNLTGSAGASVRFPSARALFEEKQGQVWVQKTRSGGLVIMYRPKTKLFGKESLVLWKLVTEVKLKPRLGFRKVVESMNRFRLKAYSEAMRAAFARISRLKGKSGG
jgi:hypothetical protein